MDLLRGCADILLWLYPDAVIHPWPGCVSPQRFTNLAVGIGIAGAVIAGIQCQHSARRAAAVAAPDVFVCVDVEPPALVPTKGQFKYRLDGRRRRTVSPSSSTTSAMPNGNVSEDEVMQNGLLSGYPACFSCKLSHIMAGRRAEDVVFSLIAFTYQRRLAGRRSATCASVQPLQVPQSTMTFCACS